MTLGLTQSQLTSEQTEGVLSALRQSKSLNTIEDVYLNMEGANFTSDAACLELAQFLDEAPNLTACFIED